MADDLSLDEYRVSAFQKKGEYDAAVQSRQEIKSNNDITR